MGYVNYDAFGEVNVLLNTVLFHQLEINEFGVHTDIVLSFTMG